MHLVFLSPCICCIDKKTVKIIPSSQFLRFAQKNHPKKQFFLSNVLLQFLPLTFQNFFTATCIQTDSWPALTCCLCAWFSKCRVVCWCCPTDSVPHSQKSTCSACWLKGSPSRWSWQGILLFSYIRNQCALHERHECAFLFVNDVAK